MTGERPPATSPPGPPPLDGLRVLDLSAGIAGGYCTKLLVDAGAEVAKVEAPGGDPGRGGAGGEVPPLFRFLHASKRSVVVDPHDHGDDLSLLVRWADVVVASPGPGAEPWPGWPLAAVRAANPAAVVVTITAFGTDGPWAQRAGNEFTLQAWGGSTGGRGEHDREPLAAGGRIGEWATGLTAAVAALGTWFGAIRAGVGDHVDVSMLEVVTTIFNSFYAVAAELDGRGPRPDPVARTVDVPSIEPAADGHVGFATNSTAQFRAFAEMVGHPEWSEDPDLSRADRRARNVGRIRPATAEWTARRRVAEILAEADRRRIPAAPVGNGRVTPTFDHLVERGSFVEHPGGSFLQPERPYRLGDGSLRPAGTLAPLGADTAGVLEAARAVARGPAPGPVAEHPGPSPPLEGLRVFDLTGYWAGPYAAQVLGFLGAEVIKVESIQRPDGTRTGTAYATVGDRPWELAPLFHGANTGKLGVTLDLGRPEGLDLARRLLSHCDVLVENFSPRVVDRFGLLDEDAWRTNPGLVALRLPAWGLSGPWRERPGFAQNMEQATGLAWLTGYADGPPLVPRGPCDPIGGLHAAFAVLVALRARQRSGRGQLVEAALVDSALNVAAEQVIEWTARGRLLERRGNRGPEGAPQGVYRCAGEERWLALSVEDDAQWAATAEVLGHPEWAADHRLAGAADRRDHHDALDVALGAACAGRDRDELVEALWARGVPAAAVLGPREVMDNPQMTARGFFAPLEHPVAGRVRCFGFPACWSARTMPVHRSAPPLLGQHTPQVLGSLLGLGAEALARLEADGVWGTRPAPT